MALSPHPARCRLSLLAVLGAAPLLMAAPVLVAGAPALASTPAAWEELRLRAVQTCTAELLSRNFNVLAVEPVDSSGARSQPTEDGLLVRLKVQRPGQAARSVTCSYRWPRFSPSL